MAINEKHERRLAIFDAAYSVLAEKGYKGTSMLAVAKAAGASNETLYNWFGNKQGLLAAMIEENARSAGEALAGIFDRGEDPITALEVFGGSLLTLLTGEKAIALNRAAAADVAYGGVLGELLAENGRRRLVPTVAKAFQEAQKRGVIRDHDVDEIAEVYIAMLLGDIQIRRVIGVMDAPSKDAVTGHSQRVNELILDLFGTDEKTG